MSAVPQLVPSVAKAATTAVARPLRELVPLIQEEIEAGNAAGIEHYRRAGQMLLEAKAQVAHGEWGAWIARNFLSAAGKPMSRTTAHYYMRLASPDVQRVEHASLRGAVGIRSGTAPWLSFQKLVEPVDLKALRRGQQEKELEQKLAHELSHQLIDIGFKVLAARLHPDKGGTAGAMARLNRVREVLKGAL